MTREEAIGELKLFKGHTFTKTEEALDMAIEALDEEPSTDAVSRQAVKEQMIKYGFYAPDMTVTEFVEELPPVTPTRPKGHWIGYVRSNGTVYHCEKCGRKTVVKENFCPNCGADMREGD